MAAVHAVTGPEDALVGDANGAWRRQDAIVAARLFAGFDRLRLEQPCPTLEECIAVRRLTTLPMVLDEVITDLPTLVRAVAADAMDHVNLKVGRVGGLTRARLMRDAAVSLGLTLTSRIRGVATSSRPRSAISQPASRPLRCSRPRP